MLRTSNDLPVVLRSHLHQIRVELDEIRETLANRKFERNCEELKYQFGMLRFEIALARNAHAKAGFNPGQPREPAGNPNGGRWVQYAQTQIVIKPTAITNDRRIDDTTVKLTTTLGRVMDVVDPTPGLTAQEYGRLVHEKFADTVRILGLPGIGRDDVETTFGGAYYGARGSIRTDVVLHGDTGNVIAIYDVKTGNATIGAARAAELRVRVGVDNSVPIIELQAVHGVDRKGLTTRFAQTIWRYCHI